MSIIVLWSDNDHKKRAELLAKTYGANAYKFDEVKPVSVLGTNALVFWGHGDATSFCHLNVDAFLDVVSSWMKVNKNVNTVEMISCNLRHRQGTHPDSYTMKVVTKLKKAHGSICFKALPVAVSGMGVMAENSILKWQPASQTWAYVGTPGKEDKYMWAVCHMLEDQMPPRGTNDGYVRAHNALLASNFMNTHKFGKNEIGNIVMVPCSLNNILCVSKNASVMTGTIGTLRWMLEEIK
ncbi:hypothetical protein [Chromatium okenii]|jgi:hypothetical protein|uniref:hypothetical protein n=1 Tax=Chromatium okenii TaxID=61644 RepID=UPI0026EEAFC2|nr:hypothetical protein [Chromatium okenii]MBV5310397.1 hypothetical protein [Chromatium okenii]